jgi:Ca2+-binding EF-hand superfamily protein
LTRDASGSYRAAIGQQFGSLADGSFEQYLDRVIAEKETVKESGVDLKTQFEIQRTEPPCEESDHEGSDVSDTYESSQALEEVNVTSVDEPNAEREAMKEALRAAGLHCEKLEPPASLADLLANIFDAADEDNVGELPHHEVAKLLSAMLPGFGLELWDIHLLLTSAQENDDGFIECKPFIQSAPEIIQALQARRMAYRSRGLPGVEVPQEAVKHCFSDEVTVTAQQLTKVFEQCAQDEPSCAKWEHHHRDHHHHQFGRSKTRGSFDAAANMSLRGSVVIQAEAMSEGAGEETLSGIRRRFCLDCLQALPERLSPQEQMRLLQMLPEDEEGFIRIDELAEHLEHLRTEAMLNALVESDVLSLRKHLVLRFRHLGLEEDGKMKLWTIKQALLQADQICLARMQIHVLLSNASPDIDGLVDIAEFLGMCCVVIPHMFDAKKFVNTAELLIQKHAEDMRHAENAELEALGASRVGQIGQDGEESQEKTEVDPDTVERTLQQIITLNDDVHRNPPALTADAIYNILKTNEKEIQNLQLSDFELTGFCAEMVADAEGFVYFVDHIKKWVPIIFEQRKNRLLSRYMEENSAETLELETPGLKKLEEMFPLLPSREKTVAKRPSRRRNSSGSIKESQGSKKDSLHARSVQRRASLDESKADRSMSKLSAKEVHPEVKEPPPGRGYQRRKARMAARADDSEAPVH